MSLSENLRCVRFEVLYLLVSGHGQTVHASYTDSQRLLLDMCIKKFVL